MKNHFTRNFGPFECWELLHLFLFIYLVFEPEATKDLWHSISFWLHDW